MTCGNSEFPDQFVPLLVASALGSAQFEHVIFVIFWKTVYLKLFI